MMHRYREAHLKFAVETLELRKCSEREQNADKASARPVQHRSGAPVEGRRQLPLTMRAGIGSRRASSPRD